MRPIDANALNRELVECCNINDPIFGIVRNCQTLDVAPVVHAHFTDNNLYGVTMYECSNCKYLNSFAGAYCTNCGARMDGGADNGIDEN